MLDAILIVAVAVSAALNFYLASKVISGGKKGKKNEKRIRELEVSLAAATAQPDAISPPAPLAVLPSPAAVSASDRDEADEFEEELPASGPLPVIVILGGPLDRQYVRQIRGNNSFTSREFLAATITTQGVTTKRMPEALAISQGYIWCGATNVVDDFTWHTATPESGKPPVP